MAWGRAIVRVGLESLPGGKCGNYLSHLLGHFTEVWPGPLVRYGIHQETISGRPEQIYTPSDTRLEWPGEGLLFESDSNDRQGKNATTI